MSVEGRYYENCEYFDSIPKKLQIKYEKIKIIL